MSNPMRGAPDPRWGSDLIVVRLRRDKVIVERAEAHNCPTASMRAIAEALGLHGSGTPSMCVPARSPDTGLPKWPVS